MSNRSPAATSPGAATCMPTCSQPARWERTLGSRWLTHLSGLAVDASSFLPDSPGRPVDPPALVERDDDVPLDLENLIGHASLVQPPLGFSQILLSRLLVGE